MRKTASELKSFLTGLILGDGYIGNGVRARSFSIKSINEDFIVYVSNVIKENTNFKIRVNDYEQNGMHKPYWELTITAHPYFSKIYHYFYDDTRKRIIHKDILKYLTPEALANWYMSDGYIVHVGKTKNKIVDRRVELATDRYSEKDVDRVIIYFNKIYGFNCKKIKRKTGVYRIRFPLVDAQKLFVLISKYIVPSFYYKINLCYEYKPIWMLDEYYNLMMKLNSTVHLYKKDDDIV